MPPKTLKIAISAGELSGDEHAAELAKALRAQFPAVVLRGMGGRNMRSAGVDTVVDSETSASVMGFQEVLSSIGSTLASLRIMRRLLREWRPDLLILVDYPDFNFRLAAQARNLAIPVFYYIPPQLWAWRAGRVSTIQRDVTAAALIFPFERSFYRQRGYNTAYYVGHPFIDSYTRDLLSAEEQRLFLHRHGLDPTKPVVALLPGSRAAELKRHLPLLSSGFALLRQRHPEVQGIIPAAPTVAQEILNAPMPDGVVAVRGNSLSVLQSAHAGALKSGTSNLQAAVCGLPFTMFYCAPRFSEWIARSFATVSSFSIVNNIRPGTVEEYLQSEASPENIANELSDLLFDKKRRQIVSSGLKEVRELLRSHDEEEIFKGYTTAGERAARIALTLVGC